MVLHANLERRDGGYTLDIAESPPTGLAGIGDWGFAYSYNETGPLPVRVAETQAVHSTGSFTLKEFHEGELLQPADRWPKTLPPFRPDEEDLFPGSDEDFLGIGATYSDALEFLELDQPSVGSALENGGCVMFSNLSVSPGYVSILGAVNLTKTYMFEFTILERTGTAATWQVFYETDVAGRKEWSTGTQKPANLDYTCEEASRAAGPTRSIGEFFEKGNYLSAKVNPPDLLAANDNWPPLERYQSSWGTLYILHFGPDPGEMHSPYKVEYVASSGYLNYMFVHQSVMEDLDRNGWPSLMD
jgi:hypothetical protein